MLEVKVETSPEDSESQPLPVEGTTPAESLEAATPVRSLALTGLFVLALFYSFYFLRNFIAPLVFALLLNFVLSPIVRGLKRFRIPEPLGAGVVILLLLGGIGYGLFALSEPATEWIAKVPSSVGTIEQKIKSFRKPVEKMSRTAERVEEMTNLNGNKTQQVQVQHEPLMNRVFSGAWEAVVSFLALTILLYFMLASGDLFLKKMIKVLPRFRDKKTAVEIARRMEDHVSTYLFTITIIFTCLGTAVGISMWIIGLPSPLLWGVMAAVFNYVPYLGAATGIGVVAIVSFLTFPSTAHALLAPGVYLLIAIIEGQLVTPIVLGKRLTLNPVVVFISLLFWGWMWGILGAFLAIPMVSTFKIFCDQIEPLAPIGEFLGD